MTRGAQTAAQPSMQPSNRRSRSGNIYGRQLINPSRPSAVPVTFGSGDPPSSSADDDAKLIENERWKYLATFLNTMAAASITVGIFTPLAGILAKGFQAAPDVDLFTVGGFIIIWLGLGAALHCAASLALGKLRS